MTDNEIETTNEHKLLTTNEHKLLTTNGHKLLTTNGHEWTRMFMTSPLNTRKRQKASQTSADNCQRQCLWPMADGLWINVLNL